MKKLVQTLALAGLVAVPALAMAEGGPISANVGLYTDYKFRGISQTENGAALQGGFDYEHASGVYAGVWASNVDSTYLNGSNVEMDVYAGYNGSITDDLSFSVGGLYYYYPTQWNWTGTDINTFELNGSVSWKWITAKVSYSTTDYFGVANSDGTYYAELGFEYGLPMDIGFSAHYGVTRLSGAGNSAADYDDYSIGLSKSYMGLDFGLSYVSTDIGSAHPLYLSGLGNKVADGSVVLSVGKSF